MTSSEIGSLVYVAGQFEKTTGFLERGVFVQNLKPGHYSVQVEKEGYYPVVTEMIVHENFVSEFDALLVPVQPVFVSLEKTSEEYKEKSALFAIPFPNIKNENATSSKREGKNPIELLVEGGSLSVAFQGDKTSMPKFFCKMECKTNLLLWSGREKIHSAFFYPERNDSVIFSIDSGVFVLQIGDGRNIFPLYEGGTKTDVRLDEKKIYIKDGGEIFRLK